MVFLTGVVLGQGQVRKPAKWVPTPPDEILFRSKGSALVQDDNSVEFEGDKLWQEFTLCFELQKLVQVEQIRIEFFPSISSSALNHSVQHKQPVLFDVKSRFENSAGQMEAIPFTSCVFLGNLDDESTSRCIDHLTDTGWTVPPFIRPDQSHSLVLRFADPVKLQGEHRMTLTLDAGGSTELDTLSRLRVSVVATDYVK